MIGPELSHFASRSAPTAHSQHKHAPLFQGYILTQAIATHPARAQTGTVMVGKLFPTPGSYLWTMCLVGSQRQLQNWSR